jgi:phage-related minor tail protein
MENEKLKALLAEQTRETETLSGMKEKRDQLNEKIRKKTEQLARLKEGIRQEKLSLLKGSLRENDVSLYALMEALKRKDLSGIALEK